MTVIFFEQKTFFSKYKITLFNIDISFLLKKKNFPFYLLSHYSYFASHQFSNQIKIVVCENESGTKKKIKVKTLKHSTKVMMITIKDYNSAKQ